MSEPLWRRLRDDMLAVPGRIDASVDEHQRIFEAVRDGRPDDAATFARAPRPGRRRVHGPGLNEQRRRRPGALRVDHRRRTGSRRLYFAADAEWVELPLGKPTAARRLARTTSSTGRRRSPMARRGDERVDGGDQVVIEYTGGGVEHRDAGDAAGQDRAERSATSWRSSSTSGSSATGRSSAGAATSGDGPAASLIRTGRRRPVQGFARQGQRDRDPAAGRTLRRRSGAIWPTGGQGRLRRQEASRPPAGDPSRRRSLSRARARPPGRATRAPARPTRRRRSARPAQQTAEPVEVSSGDDDVAQRPSVKWTFACRRKTRFSRNVSSVALSCSRAESETKKKLTTSSRALSRSPRARRAPAARRRRTTVVPMRSPPTTMPSAISPTVAMAGSPTSNVTSAPAGRSRRYPPAGPHAR